MFKKKNYIKFFVLFFLLSEFLMPPTPSEITLSLILFVALYVIIWMLSLTELTTKKNVTLLSVFLIFLSTISMIALIKGVPVGDIVRGIMPFVFIMTFYPFVVFLNSGKLKPGELFIITLIYASMYSVYNIYLFVWNQYFSNEPVYRITILDPNTISSVPLFLAIVSFYMYMNSEVGKKRIYFLLFFLVGTSAILVTQTRSMMLTWAIFVLLILIASIFQMNKEKLKRLVFLSCFSVMSFILVFPIIKDQQIFLSIINRVFLLKQGDRNVTERIDEYKAAMDVLEGNVLLGGGIGLRFSPRYGELVNYVHNSVMYTLANIGIIGLLIVILFMIYYYVKSIKTNNLYVHAFLYSFLGLYFFSLFFSTYKWFSHNILISVCISMTIYYMESKNVKV